MPITNAEYKGNKGGVHYYEYTDQTGRVWKEKWKHSVGIDPVAWMTTTGQTRLENNLARHEVADAYREAKQGNNPDKEPPDHQSQADFDRLLLAELMQDESIETTIASLPFWTAHQARSGNNANARADTLGVPRTEYAEVDSRFSVAQGIAGGVNTWKSETWANPPSEAWR